MKLLHLNSSVLGPHSVSRQVSAAIVDRLRQATPGLDISYRDLTTTPLSHLSGLHLAASQGAAPDAALQPDIAAGQAVLDEFLAADIVVIGAPMYNFTIPSQLKAWIDRILVAGKTFKYGPEGVQGLAGGKRVIVALSRGGFYGAGTPTAGGLSIWRPICARCSALSASPIRNSFPPTAFRLGPSIGRKRSPVRWRPRSRLNAAWSASQLRRTGIAGPRWR